MKDKLDKLAEEERSVRLRRHQAQCSICQHPQRQEIEDAWMNWANTTLLAKDYDVSRDAVYRHMRALDLFKMREKRVKLIYEKILERLDMVSVNGATLLGALREYTALLEKEKAERGSTGASQEVSELEPSELVKDESLPEGGTSDSSEGETGAADVGNQEAEQGAAPVPTQDVQNVEPTTTIILQ